MANRNNRKSGKNRRPQAVKNNGNREMMQAFQEIRRSSSTTPVPSGTVYRRKPKHNDWTKEN